MAKIVLILCLFFVGFCAAKEVTFSVCDDKKTTLIGNLSELEIIPCDEEPCGLKRGSNVTMKAHFKLNKDSTGATSIVHAKIEGFEVPFPLPNPNACTTASSGITCPLKSGSTYVYSAVLPVKSEYPQIDAPVKWELQDPETKKDIFCFVISIKIVG